MVRKLLLHTDFGFQAIPQSIFDLQVNLVCNPYCLKLTGISSYLGYFRVFLKKN